MNSPKDINAYQTRASNDEKERPGTDADRPEEERIADTDEDPSAEPLLGARHEEEEEEEEDDLPLSDDDGSSDLQQGK
jgi:hypothetical protein